MCKKTVKELEQEVAELEHQLEIARLRKRVRDLKDQIDKENGCPQSLYRWSTEVSSATTPPGQYTIYY